MDRSLEEMEFEKWWSSPEVMDGPYLSLKEGMLLAWNTRSRLSVQGEELPELELLPKDFATPGEYHRAARDERERQLRAAYAEIKRLSQPPAGLPERPQRTSERFVSAYPVEQAEAYFEVLEQEVRRLKGELTAMTEDRNLWQDAHDEDCPNKAALSESRADALKAVQDLRKEDVSEGDRFGRGYNYAVDELESAILARMEKAS